MTHQQRIFMILKSLAIEFEPVDIAGPGMDDQKDIMRSQAWLPDGYSHILRLYVFGPSGLKDYGSATLRCKI